MNGTGRPSLAISSVRGMPKTGEGQGVAAGGRGVRRGRGKGEG